MSIDKTDCVFLGVDIGGTYLRMGIVDENGVLEQTEKFSSRKIEGEDAPLRLVNALDVFIRRVDRPIAALALGCPSVLDKDRRRIVNTPNLQGLNDVPLSKILQEHFHVPAFLGKDATMLLWGDMRRLNIPEKGLVTGIYIGTGIGNSLLLNGEELAGKDGAACELGHIPVPGRTEHCGCGLVGCIELYAGGKALARMANETFPETGIKDLFSHHAGSPEVGRYLNDLAAVVLIEIHILNPDHIILGGGVLDMEDFPLERLLELIRTGCRSPFPRDTLQIAPVRSPDPFRGVVGAALWAAHHLKKQEETV